MVVSGCVGIGVCWGGEGLGGDGVQEDRISVICGRWFWVLRV